LCLVFIDSILKNFKFVSNIFQIMVQNWKLDGEQVVVTNKNTIIWEDNIFFKIHFNGNIFHGEIMEESLENGLLRVKVNHREFLITKSGPLDKLISELGLDKVKVRKLQQLKSPMPGRIVSISVNVGDSVDVGTPLLTLEAMKMENVLKSDGTGIVKSIDVKSQEVVDKGAVLISFE
jgi:biotin carboxyl carrier protein